MEKQESKMINLTGLWKSKSGNSLQGKLGNGAKLVIIPNNRKTEDKQPDYLAFIAPSEAPKPAQQSGFDPNFDKSSDIPF